MRELTTIERVTISVDEAAVMLGISRTSAYEYIRTGQLPAIRMGRRLLVPLKAISNNLLDGSVGDRTATTDAVSAQQRQVVSRRGCPAGSQQQRQPRYARGCTCSESSLQSVPIGRMPPWRRHQHRSWLSPPGAEVRTAAPRPYPPFRESIETDEQRHRDAKTTVRRPTGRR